MLQQAVLNEIKNGNNTPTAIGIALGKDKKQANSFANGILKQLLKLEAVEKGKDGYNLPGQAPIVKVSFMPHHSTGIKKEITGIVMKIIQSTDGKDFYRIKHEGRILSKKVSACTTVKA